MATTIAAPRLSPERIADLGEKAIPIAVLAVVLALIVPLPAMALDLLIVVDIMLSLVVMMVAVNIAKPVDFNTFPTMLLLLTLFRLALNVSSSRLILLNGNGGTSAAGHVIEAFGSFVVGGSYIVGTVIFLVLCAIQYVVINHGAVRISEVTARFTLDALPGKQMSIDADLNAGLIDETEARKRRKDLASEAEFYGAMDGASRFTQRDAVASLLITAINIIAGFLIGVFQHNMEFGKALQTYTVLTIGDGLVTVVPALMISVSGGLIVTRATSDSKLGAQLQKQLFTNHRPLLYSGIASIGIGLFPGLPTVPFFLLGGALTAAGWKLRRDLNTRVEAATTSQAAPKPEMLESLLQVETVSIEVGLGLVSMLEGGSNSTLVERIAGIRRQLASQMGLLLPSVKVTDSVSLRSREYVILLRGAEIARYELVKGHQLAISSGKSDVVAPGKLTKEPAFGLAAWWIKAEEAESVRQSGLTVVDDVSVLSTHFAEILRRYAHEIFTRQDTKLFCDRVAAVSPKLVEDLVPKLLSFSSIQRVLQNLLRERVSIRDAVAILEALGGAAAMTHNTIMLTEYVRQSIRRTLVKPLLTPNHELTAYFVDHGMETTIEQSLEHGENNTILALPPNSVRDIINRVIRSIPKPGTSAVLITTTQARYHLRQILEAEYPHLVVLSNNEIPPEVTVRSLGTLQ